MKLANLEQSFTVNFTNILKSREPSCYIIKIVYKTAFEYIDKRFIA